MKKGLMLALVLCAAILIAAPVARAEPTVFKISMAPPEGHPVYVMGNMLGKMLVEKTGGKLTAKSFANSQLGDSSSTMEALKMGILEMGVVPSATVSQLVPSWEVFSLPYLFKDEAHMFKALNGEFGQTLAKDLESKGIALLGWINAGSRNVVNYKRPIKTPADMEGIKICVIDSKLAIDTLNTMGGIAFPTPLSENARLGILADFLDRREGAINGYECNPSTQYTLTMSRVSYTDDEIEYFSWTRHFMTPDVLIISTSVLKSLPPDRQKMVRDLGKQVTEIHNDKIWVEYIADVLVKMKSHNIKFNEVDNVQAFMDATKPVKEAYSKKHGTKYLDMAANAAQ